MDVSSVVTATWNRACGMIEDGPGDKYITIPKSGSPGSSESHDISYSWNAGYNQAITDIRAT